GFESPSWTDLLRLLAGSLSTLALLWLVWARFTRPQRDGWSQLMHTAQQRLQRAGIQSSSSDSARSLARSVQKQWSANSPLAATLSDWLLDMERLRYAAPSTPDEAALKTLRQRWQTIKRQSWPPTPKNSEELKT
ncbi:MAG: DUF3488 domain-containing protein, partial [Comamonas sp.]